MGLKEVKKVLDLIDTDFNNLEQLVYSLKEITVTNPQGLLAKTIVSVEQSLDGVKEKHFLSHRFNA
ncbi:hypothetical protein [Legionella bononiensis]|uniref:Uncharacterized protein n=1 Tax=Legionella bononiensis TaxID=2793102 RepID=A0ABS1WE13_9GAMM|nr:hypothetical protein [Legionella bononiensis]MBL7479530.1 hypothetical protein [Legionella bononiensis]MBL7527596.1 hypothetical protein [Legionella bononiensis]